MPLPLTEARRYADKAIEIAAARSLRVGVVVVDELGLLVQMDRMDGAPLMAPDVAEAKALTALNFQRPTSEVAREYANDPQQLTTLQEVVHFKILARPGGLPIVRDGQLIGAIGVEGATAEQDEQLASAAVS
jgi:glc operon protein GlcG